MSKEWVNREEHDQQVGGYLVTEVFFFGDATHVNNVDGLEEVKLDIKDSVEALPQIPMEAATGYAIAEHSRVQKLASFGYSRGQQHTRETKSSDEQACKHWRRFFYRTHRCKHA